MRNFNRREHESAMNGNSIGISDRPHPLPLPLPIVPSENVNIL